MQLLGQSWLILRLTGSGVALGALVSLQFLPLLVFSPWAGVLIEHVDKRRLLMVTQTLGLVLASLLGLLVMTSVIRVWTVFVLALALGLINAVEGPTRQVFVFDLVGVTLIGNAVSLNEVIINASRVFGPAMGGIVISLLGISACFVLNAVSYLPAILALILMRLNKAKGLKQPRLPPQQLWEGVRYARSHPVIRSLLLMAAGSAMIFNFGVALPVLARDLKLRADGYGVMVAAFGLGALVGALIAASAHPPTLRQIRALALLSSVLVIAAAYMPNLPSELAAQACAGAVSICFVALANAALQQETSQHMRSRIMGLWSMGLPGSSLVTGLLVGGAASLGGGRLALTTVGLILLATVLLGWSALDRDQRSPGGCS